MDSFWFEFTGRLWETRFTKFFPNRRGSFDVSHKRIPGRTVPAKAGCENKERQTDAPVPMSILPATCEQHYSESGRIDHRYACGKKFRVAGGNVTGRMHKHACPTCGTIVYSEQERGQIKATHRNTAGRTCRRESWYATTPLH